MSNNEITCIKCPKGCDLILTTSKGQIEISGNGCPKGEFFAIEELTDPKRNIATSLPINGRDYHTLSVRLSDNISRIHIEEVIEIINKTQITPPIRRGDILVKNINNLGVDVIATRNVH